MSAGSKSSAGPGGGLRLLIGIAISIGALAFVVTGVDWHQFWLALQGADYWWLLPSLGSMLVAIALKVLKWQALLRPAGRTTKTNLFYSINIGYLVSDVLPGRLGEIARVYVESRLDRLNPAAVLASVAVDRILDIAVLVLLLAVALPTADLPPIIAQSGLLFGVASFALLAICVALAYPFGRNLLMRILAASPRFPGKPLIEKWSESLLEGLQGLRGLKSLSGIVALSVAIWLVTALVYYFGQLAFHVNAPIWAAVLVLCLTNLGMVVPSTPGYIGVFHGLVVLALGAFGVEKELALGYAIVMHLMGFVPVGVIGAFSLWRCGFTLLGWRETATEAPVPSDSQAC